jgi:hypothetical protein
MTSSSLNSWVEDAGAFVASLEVSDDEHPARLAIAMALMENVRIRDRIMSYFLIDLTV